MVLTWIFPSSEIFVSYLSMNPLNLRSIPSYGTSSTRLPCPIFSSTPSGTNPVDTESERTSRNILVNILLSFAYVSISKTLSLGFPSLSTEPKEALEETDALRHLSANSLYFCSSSSSSCAIFLNLSGSLPLSSRSVL